MNKEREVELFHKTLCWIFEHTGNYEEYADILLQIGYTKDELIEELESNCGIDSREIIGNLFGGTD